MDPFSWVMLIVALASAVYSVCATASVKATSNDASTLEDFDMPTADDGKQMPVIFGTVTLKSSNIVWYGDLDYKKIEE